MSKITSYLARMPSAQIFLPWVVCLAGGMLFFYESIQMCMFNSLNSSLMAAFHTDEASLGLLSSVYFYTNCALIFIAGNLLDRFSPRRLILIAMTLCTLGTIGFSFADSLGFAAFTRFFVGVGGAFCFLGSVKLASRWFPPKHMALAIGVIVTLYMFGGMVGQTPLATLVHHFGWRAAIFADGMLGVVLTFIMWLVIQDRPQWTMHLIPSETEKLKSIGLKKAILLVLKNPQNWFGALYTCLMNFPIYLIGAFMGSIYLIQVDHFSLTQAATICGMLYTGSIFGSPFMGFISDRLGSRRLPMIISSILSIILVLPIIYVQGLSYETLLIAFFLLGFITSAQIIGYPAVAEHNPRVLTGTGVSIVSMVTVGGGAILLPFSGWLLDISGSHTVVNNITIFSPEAYHHAMLILPIAFVCALIFAIFLTETHCKTLHD
jgi:MFS family permease